MTYRTSPADLEGMPPGVPHIVGNEAAERFSFYGMKAVLAVFMVQYLHLLDGPSAIGMSNAESSEKVHLFSSAVYLTPIIGALLADCLWGKYRTIMILSLVYCAGHAALALMGQFGNSPAWLFAGLCLIALGSGGIKPCVSAHVGDQFGSRNAHLLSKVFQWFYFSINTGAVLSGLLTPWLLEWYGPHWAFGVPGVLMALATLIFWMGRKRFIHVPASGAKVWHEFIRGGGFKVLLKLLPLYAFVMMFWALFDQTATRFVFQAQDLDRSFLGIEWLPSQLQSLNSIFVLTFIPLFVYVVYPLVDRVWKLTPLRKIGAGLFVMVIGFGLVAVVQQWVDGGAMPNIGWQIAAIAIITAAEVMVSIVSLEYAYTQAPKTMKSLLMCFYLVSVAVGNLFVAGVNHFIQIPSAAEQQWELAVEELEESELEGLDVLVLPGHDGKAGTDDDLTQKVIEGRRGEIVIPGQSLFEEAARRIEGMIHEAGGTLPDEARVGSVLADLKDPWGNPLEYLILNSASARLISAGPDRKAETAWDVGMILTLAKSEEEPVERWSDRFHPDEPWLDRWKRELGMGTGGGTEVAGGDLQLIDLQSFSGGQSKLLGASYFWFFTWMMLGTAILFVPYAMLYRPRTVLQD